MTPKYNNIIVFIPDSEKTHCDVCIHLKWYATDFDVTLPLKYGLRVLREKNGAKNIRAPCSSCQWLPEANSYSLFPCIRHTLLSIPSQASCRYISGYHSLFCICIGSPSNKLYSYTTVLVGKWRPS